MASRKTAKRTKRVKSAPKKPKLLWLKIHKLRHVEPCSWIEDCIKAVGDRQVFLASQNPLLLDYLEFDSTEKVGRSFIQCRVKPEKAGDQMRWSNLSDVDAARFFDAYQVGLQHVSEILRTKGLW